MSKVYFPIISSTIINNEAGLVILNRNYLVVYPYDKWSGKEIPEFQEGEEFQPTACELKDGNTSKPNLLTEADLVNLMDKNGIGIASRFPSRGLLKFLRYGRDNCPAYSDDRRSGLCTRAHGRSN